MLASLVMQPYQTFFEPREFSLHTCGRRLLEAAYDELRRSDIPPESYELVMTETFGDDDLPKELRRRPDAVWVDQVSAYPAGQGTGRRVLALLVEAADRERVALALVPTPFLVVDGLAYGPLIDWCERLGFTAMFDDSVWVREPRL